MFLATKIRRAMNNVFVGRVTCVQADAKAFTVLAFNALSENLILTEYKD
jgi:hypothetical protein